MRRPLLNLIGGCHSYQGYELAEMTGARVLVVVESVRGDLHVYSSLDEWAKAGKELPSERSSVAIGQGRSVMEDQENRQLTPAASVARASSYSSSAS